MRVTSCFSSKQCLKLCQLSKGKAMSKKSFTGKIRVLDRLKMLIPPLNTDEIRILEQSLVEEGKAYNALWLWGDVLVDGHHRYELCKRLDIPYTVQQVYESAQTIDDVEYRMKRDAIGRRNLTPVVMSRFRAEMVMYHVSGGKGKQEAVKLVADESGVSERQVYRDVERAELVETIADEAKEAADSLSGPALKKLADLPKGKQKAAAKRSGGDGKKLLAEIKNAGSQDLETEAKKFKALANKHRDKLVLAIDDYARIKKNPSEQDRLVKIVQKISLW